MTAEEIMTADPVTISENGTLSEAIEILCEKDIRHLPVIRNGEVVGMLSDRDIRGVGLSVFGDLKNVDKLRARLSARVASLMSGDVVTVERSTPLAEIVDLMLSEKVGAVPVVEEDTNKLVGIISYVDILQVLRDLLE